MATRKIPKNYRNLTGVVASNKQGPGAAFESTLERDLLILLDFDPVVSRYEEQPVTLQYRHPDGGMRKYTPDLLVEFCDCGCDTPRPWLIEVKYESELREKWEEFRPRFRAAVRYARERGWLFRIFTEKRIRTIYLDNAVFLRRYLRPLSADGDAEQLLAMLHQLRESSPDALLAALRCDRWNRAVLMPALWHLIAHRRIEADLTRPLTMASRIWLSAQEEAKLEYEVLHG